MCTHTVTTVGSVPDMVGEKGKRTRRWWWCWRCGIRGVEASMQPGFCGILEKRKKGRGEEKEGEVCGSFVIQAASHDCWKQDST